MRLETIHPKELGPADIARWRALQRANEGLRSPYLTPDWARVIGGVRDDARVCVIGGGQAFFGAQRLSRFTAMGLGAPIADYQGVVGATDIDAATLCRALQVGRIDLTHVPESATPMKAAGAEGSWLAETSGGREIYEATLKQRRSEFVRQTEKKARKMARDIGDVELRARSPERRHFETLIAWKNEQLRRTGQPLIWAKPWVRQALDACFDAAEPHFSGALFTLSLGERLAAAAFCLRSSQVLHLWLIGHDPEFDQFSPGVQLARWIVCWAADNGLAEVDFGPGDYQYKRQLSTTQRVLQRGVMAGPTWSGAVRRTEHAVRARLEVLPQPRLAALPGKAMRRLDLMRALSA